MSRPSQCSDSYPHGFDAFISQSETIRRDMSAADIRALSPLALAYIGDAVYELFIRSCLLMPPKPVRIYHRQAVDHVRAEQQSSYLDGLRPHLTDNELDIVRRGRNAASSRRPRANLRDYQQATALEALIGYLYLTDPPRLNEILNHLPLKPEPSAPVS